MNASELPQFVTITFDDSINSHAIHLFRKYLLSVRTKHDCLRVRFTCFVSFDASECDAIQILVRKKVVEFGHHTFKHTRLPSEQDIRDAVDSLVACGVPKSYLGGFRAPYLDYNQTTFDSLYANQVLYDATIIPRDDAPSEFGKENQWPFTLEHGFLGSSVKCGNTGTCAEDKSYPGMWQIPLYRWYHANNTFSNDAMDYGTFEEDVQQNFERRYFGNRAPFGIYLHAYWLEENGLSLRKWIQRTLDQYDDVFFVTNLDLLQWMMNPVPKTMYVPPMCNADEYQPYGVLQTSTSSAQPSFDAQVKLAELSPNLTMRKNTSPDKPTLTEVTKPMRWVLFAQFVGAVVIAMCILGRIRRNAFSKETPAKSRVTDKVRTND